MDRNKYNSFISVVVVIQNEDIELELKLEQLSSTLEGLSKDYEIIIIDNTSDDCTLPLLKKLCEDAEFPNLQIFSLLSPIDYDLAVTAGIEQALGDFVFVMEIGSWDLSRMQKMIDLASTGSDVVFANNSSTKNTFFYRLSSQVFYFLYKRFTGIDLSKDVGQQKVFSRRAANYILSSNRPEIALRHMHASIGFTRETIEYSSQYSAPKKTGLLKSINRGIGILVSSSNAPLRLVTFASMAGGIVAVTYSCFVIWEALTNSNVAPGWASLSLQLSFMFFLLSLVLLVLGEYMIRTNNHASEYKGYYFSQEFNSSRMTRLSKLNVEISSDSKNKANLED